jgi:hypothetical protein
MEKCYIERRGKGRTSYNEKREGKLDLYGLRRNCFLKHVIEGKVEGMIEVTGRRGRRHKQLWDDLKENREYCKFLSFFPIYSISNQSTKYSVS